MSEKCYIFRTPASESEKCSIFRTLLTDLDFQEKELSADRARTTDALNATGGDDAVACLEANRSTLLVEIEDLALLNLRLKPAAWSLNRASAFIAKTPQCDYEPSIRSVSPIRVDG